MNDFDPTTVPGTAEELLTLLTEHTGWVSKCLESHLTSWPPSLTVMTRDSPAGKGGLHLYVLQIPFNEHREKREAIRGIGRRLYAEQMIPAAVVMSTEAWISPDPGPGRLPADHPERQEAIIIAGSTLGGRHMALQRMIVTRQADEKLLAGEWEPPETDGVITKLLNELWAGYFEVVIQKHGSGRPGPRPG